MCDALSGLNGFCNTALEELVILCEVIIKKEFYVTLQCSEENFEVNNGEMNTEGQLPCLRQKVVRN